MDQDDSSETEKPRNGPRQERRIVHSAADLFLSSARDLVEQVAQAGGAGAQAVCTYGGLVLDPGCGDLVAERFGLGERASLDGPVAFGRLGEIWRLVTERGRYAVKHAQVAAPVEDAALDAAFQASVRRAGVPMPAVVRAVDGMVVADVNGEQVRVYEWIDVLPADRRLDPRELGQVLAAIHSVVVTTDAPVDGWYVDPVGAETWRELLARLRTAGAPFVDRFEDLLPSVCAAEGILTSPRRVQVCHRDLWADNVRRTPDGGLVVLDWENSGPGDVNGELGCALFEYGLGQVDRMRTLYAAYLDAGGHGRLVDRGDLTMLVAQLGNIARVGCERWFASSSDHERARNADWVGEFLDEPVTLETVDRILHAVNG